MDEHTTALGSSRDPRPGDATLIHSAQLVSSLSYWYQSWRENENVMDRFELSRKVNLELERCHMEFESASLSGPQNPLLDIVYLFGKAVTHASMARICDPRDDDQRALKRPNWAAGVDASIEIIKLCSDLAPMILTSFPITLYTVSQISLTRIPFGPDICQMLDQTIEIILEASKSSNTFWMMSCKCCR